MTNIFNNSYNSYNSYNNPQQQRQNNSINQIQNILKNIYAYQNQPELGLLIQSLQNTQAMNNKQLQQVLQVNHKPVDPNQYMQLKNRCQKIKTKNQKILLGIMNIRQKLIRLTSMNAQIIQRFQIQNRVIQQKNLKLRRQIQQKVMYLKQNGMRKRTLQNIKNKKQYKPVFAVLKQLKEGTVCLQKQIVRQKTDMEITLKQLSH